MKIRYKNQFDKQRRDLLKVITGAGVSKGLLNTFGLAGSMMLSRLAEANTAPTKTFALYVAGGVIPNLYTPVQGNNGPVMQPMSQGYADEGVVGDIHFLTDAKVANAGHGTMTFRFGGSFYGRASYDYMMAKTIGANHPLDILNLGIGVGITPTKGMTGESVNTINDPASAMQKLTSALGGGGGGGNETGNSRQLFVDLHRDAIKALNSKVLGQGEKEKLDMHLTSIEELEKKLAAQASSGNTGNGAAQACSNIVMPPSGGDDFGSQAELNLDIAMLALSCNATASASLCLGDDGSAFSIPVFPGGIHNSHHLDTVTWGQYITTAGYMFSLAAKAVRKFRDAGLFDDVLMLQTCDMGNGNTHTAPKTPMFMAGAGVTSKGVANNVNGKTDLAMFETAAQILGADSHPDYSGWSSDTIGLSV